VRRHCSCGQKHVTYPGSGSVTFGQEPNPESLGTVRYIMVKDVAKASWQAGDIFTAFGSNSSFSHSSFVSPILSSPVQPQNFQRRVSTDFTFMWPYIVTNFFLIKPTRPMNFSNFILSKNCTCFGHFLCPSSGVFYCIFDIGIFLASLMTASKQGQKPAWKLSSNLQEIYQCRIYSRKLLMMGREGARNM